MVSALKVGGRRLHELAREGIEIERAARAVRVARFDVHAADGEGVLDIEVECSSGTYVRSLAADLGLRLGGSAHLRALRRTRVGPFSVEGAVPLERLSADAIIPPAEALRDVTAQVVASEDLAAAVRHGKVLPRDALGASATADGPWAVVDASGMLLAVYEPHRDGTVKPGVVLVP
jgi:tRNA pseudouridine55 synthase